MNSAVICADIGTTSLKTALVDNTGAVLFYKRTGFEEKGTGQRWYDAFCEAAAQAAKTAQDKPYLIEGICISGNGPTLCACSGETLLWNETPEPALNRIRTVNTTSAHSRSLFIPRLILFKNTYPDIWEKSPYIFSGPEYLIWRLTGQAVTILPEKRYKEAYWTEDALREALIEPEKLPQFVTPAFNSGTLTPEAALRTGLAVDIPVFCGAPDFIVALIGTDTLRAGSICDRAGSSEGINLCIKPYPAEIWTTLELDSIRVLPSVIPELYNASILIPDSGTRFSLFKKETAPDTVYADFVAGILAHPQKNKKGLQLLSNTAQKIKNAVELLSKLSKDAGYGKPSCIRTTGGQAKNESWMQYKADTLGIPIEIMNCPDAELIGDAVLAYVGLKQYSTIAEGASQLVKPSRIFEPQSGVFK